MRKLNNLLDAGEVEALIGSCGPIDGLGGAEAGLGPVAAGRGLHEASARSNHVRLVDRRGHHRGDVRRGLQ